MKNRTISVAGIACAALAMLAARLQAGNEMARRTGDFVDSIGVNGNDPTLIGDLGILHVRSGRTSPPDKLTENKQVYASYGTRSLIESNIFYANPGEGNYGQGIKMVLDGVKAYPAGNLAVLGGANEPDNFGFNWLGNTYGYGAKAWQEDFYPMMKSDSATQQALVSSFNYANSGLQAEHAPVNAFDLLDLHHYQGNSVPGTGLQAQISQVNALTGSAPVRPIIITECGYSVESACDYPVSPRAQARYDVRLFCETFRAGIRRTYKYNLWDTGGQTYGWAYWNGTGYTKRPGYYAVKNLLSLLKDATDFTPGWLNYSVAAPGGNVKSVLLQKKNGDFYLLLYNNVASTSGGGTCTLASDVVNSPVNATVSWSAAVIASAAQWTMSDDGSFTSTAVTVSGAQLSTAVPDSLLILRLTPSGGLAGTQSGPGMTKAVAAINCGGASAGNYAADGNYFTWTNSARTAGDGESIPAIAGGSSTTASAIDVSGVSNPAPQDVYRSHRYGITTYNINDLDPSKAYKIRLHFCETAKTAAGQRAFDVYINGWKVLDNFDVFAAAGGQNKAVVREFCMHSNSDGRLIIQALPRGAGDAMISGIEVFGTPHPLFGKTVGLQCADNSRFVSADLNSAQKYLRADWAASIGEWEKFVVEDAGGPWLALRSLADNLYVSADNNDSTKLKALWANGIGEWEKFRIVMLDDTTIALFSKISGKYVTCDRTGSGGNILRADWATGIGGWETFRWVDAGGFPMAGAWYRLAPGHAPTMALGIDSQSAAAVYNYSGAATQRWKLEDAGSGFFRITPQANASQCLDVWGVQTNNGAQVGLYAYGGYNNQLWKLEDAGSGFYRLTPKHATTQCLDVYGAGTADGASAVLWQYLGGSNQKWRFVTP